MISSSGAWFGITGIGNIDTPALVVYKERVRENIGKLKRMVKSTASLRPHIKTHKMKEACILLLQEGIHKFKCATIAEAELLAVAGAGDVLLAYQPVGPKINRFLNLIRAYPQVRYSCIIDHSEAAGCLDAKAAMQQIVADVYIDLNVGMNRTGIAPEKALALAAYIRSCKNLRLAGLHAYDGHIKDTDPAVRERKADDAFQRVLSVRSGLEEGMDASLNIVISGTPTFPAHARHENVECSPGTFIFSDFAYRQSLPDLPFDYAALVITRVISIIDEHTICTDLGHKSIAAENPFPRVHFLNAPDARQIAQSEEHLVLSVRDASLFSIGDVLFGVPLHICPTVALYEKAYVIENKRCTGTWKVEARDRSIGF